MKRVLHVPVLFHRALRRAIDHDSLNIAQSAAYSAMVALFPALIVAAAFISLLPDNAPLRYELSSFFDHILPSDVSPILQSYFAITPHTARSTRALLLALFVSITGASSVIATFMEGVRRANGLPPDCWGFWARRARAYALVPLSLVPLAVASSLIIFGHIFTGWLSAHVAPSVRAPVLILAFLIRWAIALMGSVGLIALIYHMGTPMRQSWHRTLPGALLATVMWLATTLVFGWYVTRFANYSVVYGSLGAAIALLFWLYIVSFSVLCGAEFNAQLFLHPLGSPTANSHAHASSHG